MKPKPMSGVPAGNYPLLAGEWLKICRGIKKFKWGKAFLAKPKDEQYKVFKKLARVAISGGGDEARFREIGVKAQTYIETGRVKRSTTKTVLKLTKDGAQEVVSSPTADIPASHIPDMPAIAKRLYNQHMELWAECTDKFPDLTDYALPRLKKRYKAILERAKKHPDFFKATLGYATDKNGKVVCNPKQSLSQDTSDGLFLLREEKKRRQS